MSRETGVISTLLFLSAFLSLGPVPRALAEGAGACQDVVPVELDASWSSAGQQAFETRCFRVFAAEGGYLMVDVALLEPSQTPPRIGFLGRSREHPDETFLYLERSLTGFVVSLDGPGPYFLRVGAQDPSAPLGEYVVRTRFAPEKPFFDLDMEEPEEDPDLVVATPSIPALLPKDMEEPEEDPDLLACAGCKPLSALRRRCAAGAPGRSFFCAAPLAQDRVAGGDIRTGRPREPDVFTFRLTDFGLVRIRIAAESALYLSLYDRQGLRLALTDSATDLQLARMLGPGRYYLRVTGAEAAGGLYQLAFEMVDW